MQILIALFIFAVEYGRFARSSPLSQCLLSAAADHLFLLSHIPGFHPSVLVADTLDKIPNDIYTRK